MPREWYSIPAVADMPTVVRELNRILDSISRRLNYLYDEGADTAIDGKKFTGLDSGTADDDAVRKDQLAVVSSVFIASRLVATDASSLLTTVANLASWIAGTTNRITVTNDGDGTVTLSAPQDIHTGAAPTFAGLTKVGGASDYTEVESDGTVKFNGAATVWEDANVGGMTLGGPAATLPDEVKFTDEAGVDTGIYSWGFAVGEKVAGAIEIPHSYKEGSDITFHVHWQGNDAPTGTDKVKWQLVYTVAQVGATLDAATTITIETDYDTQYEWVISSFAAITGTNFNMGDQFLFELSRIAASADEYGGDAVIGTVGLHYESDTVGSRQITSK